MDALLQPYTDAHAWLFATVVEPLVFAAGGGNLLEDAYVATSWFLLGLLEIAVILLVLLPLQRWRPVEAQPDRRSVGVDVIYTLVHRLGLFRLAVFFLLEPVLQGVFGWLQVQGVGGFQLDRIWPGVTDRPLVSLAIYLVAFDFIEYAIHRGQHRFDWWWSLHAVHHSQRTMTAWTDNRNHLLDSLLRDVILAVVARVIGVEPQQFVVITVLARLTESLSHANVRLDFGVIGSRLVVGPRFHRLHHGIGVGHEGVHPGTLGGCNFSVLFPVWDILFGTADFRSPVQPTGIRDQIAEFGGRDYGQGFWAQQWLGLKRLARRA